MKRKNNQHLIHLPSGLRLVCVQAPGAGVEYFGVTVGAGSRDDPEGLFGLAHFVEHTIFKGTSRHRSSHLINRMESCGGELNAYTSKQSTTVYTVSPTGNLARAVELVADLVMNSSFPQAELDKEREVVADEINSYLDIPSEAVFDDFDDLLFAGSPLGHNILGNRAALDRFDSDICRSYLDRLYVAPNMVAFYSGPQSPSRVEAMVARRFADLSSRPAARPAQTLPLAPCFAESRDLAIHQAHTVVGARVCDMFSDRRFALSLLVNILGGPGMNSLLNVELREKRGLVYTVDASLSLMPDTGVFTIYFGCDASDTPLCRRLIDRAITSLADTPMTRRRFDAAVRQYVGQMTVAADNRENTVMSLARQALYRDHLIPSDQIVDRLRSLTPADLRQAAETIRPHLLSSLTFR